MTVVVVVEVVERLALISLAMNELFTAESSGVYFIGLNGHAVHVRASTYM